jgi:thiosulfate dehydrogenase [quinone] large subunit
MDMFQQLPELKQTRFIFGDTRLAPLWLVLRVYIGYIWLSAGWEKFQNPAWVGEQAGTAVTGFLNGALAKAVGAHPDVMGWYAGFINAVALPHATIFSYLVTYGEILVGLGLIVGLFTGVAAFFGLTMNFNYLFAGTTSINPLLILVQLFLLLAWRTAGHLGLDRHFFKRYLYKRSQY